MYLIFDLRDNSSLTTDQMEWFVVIHQTPSPRVIQYKVYDAELEQRIETLENAR